MKTRPLGRTGLDIVPLVFGGNVFGWTVDEKQSFALLDRFVDAGLNAIDTADSYSRFAEGNEGGESETILGNWFAADPARRDKVVLMTKVGSEMGEGKKGLSARYIKEAVEASLRRLRTDRIDLYQSHFPDENTPIEETLRAFEDLLQEGKIRAMGASNLSAAQLSQSLDVAADKGIHRYDTLQPQYNLHDRQDFEQDLRDICIENDIGVISYFSLASGFLTGKYKSREDAKGHAREGMVGKYFDARGERILKALAKVSDQTGAKPAEIALAWLIAQPGLTAPIASATSESQLQSLIRAVDLNLSEEAMRQLDKASAY